MRYALFLSLISTILITPCESPAETVYLHPVRDNTLLEDPSGAISNGSGPGVFAGNNGQGDAKRAVLAFAVAAAVPAGAIIDSVELRLYVSSAGGNPQSLTTLHRLMAAWGEGGSSASGGSGAPSQPGDATWIHRFYPDQYWDSPGGDFVASASASTLVEEIGFYSWAGDGMVTDVQWWLDTPSDDFGWLAKGNELERSTVRRYESRESGDSEYRPVLAIHYSPGPTPTLPISWGRLKHEQRDFFIPKLH